MILPKLLWKSLLNRRTTVALTLFSIALGIMLLLGVDKLRQEAKTSFANTISNTDLIIGARSGNIQLLLYSVFRIGNATNNISWESYQDIAAKPSVKWTIPISLGDSHKGYRVVGTTQDYFKYYRFGRKRLLTFQEGKPFNDLFDVVIGSDVAKQLGYKIGDSLILSHGVAKVSLSEHDDKPFRVAGILEKTGTPVDQSLHVSLQAIEAIHVDWQKGYKQPSFNSAANDVRQMDLQPKAITAMLVGLKSKVMTFKVQRDVNNYREEALLAILPGAVLQEFWSLLSVVEDALKLISTFVILTGLTTMLTLVLTSLNERRREIAILRSVGARPHFIFSMLCLEAWLLSALGSLLGVLFYYLGLMAAQPILESEYSLTIAIDALSNADIQLLLVIQAISLLMGIIPGWRAYRYTLNDGLTIKV